MSDTAFANSTAGSTERKVSSLNVATIGHVDHGKTTITKAIIDVLGSISPKFYPALKNLDDTLTRLTQESGSDKVSDVAYGLVSSSEAITLFSEIAAEGAKSGGAKTAVAEKSKAALDKAPESKARGITINKATVEYSLGSSYKFAHTDCPGHQDYVKNMITGAASIDEAFVVVGAGDSVMLQTKEHVRLVKQLGVKHIVVFLNKCDLYDKEAVFPTMSDDEIKSKYGDARLDIIRNDKDLISMVEEEIHDLLAKHGYSNVRIFRTSGLAAENGDIDYRRVIIQAFMYSGMVLSREIKRDLTGSACAFIDGVHSIAGRGTVVTGTVLRGTFNPNSMVDLVSSSIKQCKVVTIQKFHKDIPYAEAGDNVGFLLQGVKKEEIPDDSLLAAIGTVKPVKVLKVSLYVLTKEEGGRANPFIAHTFTPQLVFKSINVTSNLFIDNEGAIAVKNAAGEELMLSPGDVATVYVVLHQEAPIMKPFEDVSKNGCILREGKNTIAQGTILAVYEEVPADLMKVISSINAHKKNFAESLGIKIEEKVADKDAAKSTKGKK